VSTKLIAYDLNRPGQNYDALISAIKSLGAWWHHLDSTWLVKSSLSTSQIRDLLRPHLDSGDELLIINVTGDARSWIGFNARAGNWMRDTWD
jgi:hypothetical protein